MMDSHEFPDPNDHHWDQADRIACEAWEHYEKGQMQQALEKLTEAIDLNPAHGSWYFNTALSYFSISV